MTITTTASEIYETQPLDPVAVAEAEVRSPQRSSVSVPKMLWAGLGLFAANVAILGGVMLSPELRVSVYGQVSPEVYGGNKPSPFTPVVDESKPRKAKLAQHVRPVVEQEPVMAENSSAPAELAVPRASQAAASWTGYTAPSSRTVTGNAVYRQAESYGDFRRVTAASQELAPPTPRRVTN